MVNTICYKLKTPIIYNKGTKWEKKEDTFLVCYGYTNIIDHNAKLKELNTDEQAKEDFCNKHRLKANEIEYFFNNVQDEFDTRGN